MVHNGVIFVGKSVAVAKRLGLVISKDNENDNDNNNANGNDN